MDDDFRDQERVPEFDVKVDGYVITGLCYRVVTWDRVSYFMWFWEDSLLGMGGKLIVIASSRKVEVNTDGYFFDNMIIETIVKKAKEIHECMKKER